MQLIKQYKKNWCAVKNTSPKWKESPTMASHNTRDRNPIPVEMRRKIQAEYIACFYCGDAPDPRAQRFPPPKRLEIDHVVALGAGGTSDERNLVMACHTCNRAKGVKPVVEFIRWLREKHWRHHALV